MGVWCAGQVSAISFHQHWLGPLSLLSIVLRSLLILAQQSRQWYFVLEFVM
jgi:hypothetical protein